MQFFNALTEEKQKRTCLQFNHKGWTVSVSNMNPSDRCEVIAFNEMLGCEDLTADTIPEIIAMIDGLRCEYTNPARFKDA